MIKQLKKTKSLHNILDKNKTNSIKGNNNLKSTLFNH